MIRSSPNANWTFVGHRCLVKIKTNDVYHRLIYMHEWTTKSVTREWRSVKPPIWWQCVVEMG